MYNAANAMLQFVKDKISLSISTPPSPSPNENQALSGPV